MIDRYNRVCTYCRQKYPLNSDNFAKVKTKGFNGFGYRCSECTSKYLSKRAKEIYRRKADVHKKLTQKWKDENKEKVKASILVRKLIKNGKLKRGICETCGNPKTHGHHDDYSKPDVVRWLCQKHHRLHHVKLKLT